jgi:hypothetical protein
MDKQLRREIREDVQAALRNAVLQMEERWISGKELCRQFAMITPKFLKAHGDIFPRRKITIRGINGRAVSTHYGYAQHEIALNIANGVYDELMVVKEV